MGPGRRRLGWLAVLALLWPCVAFAEVRTSEQVRIGADERIEDNLTIFSRDVLVQGDVDGDLVVFAQKVRVEGNVTGDLLIAAQEISVEGAVGGSFRAAGQRMRLSGKVGEDALLAGSRVLLSSTGEVGGELVAAAGELELAGPIGDDARVAGGEVTVNAPIQGDLRASAGELALLPQAAIAGDLFYKSAEEADVASGATVAGRTERGEAPTKAPGPAGIIGGILFFALRFFVGVFALGALFVLILPRFARQAPAALENRPWTSLGWGAVALLGTPVLAILLFVVGAMIGGWWLGLVLLALYTVALALSVPVSGMAIGEWLLRRFHHERFHLISALAIGVALLMVLGFIPVLNVLVALAVVLFGLGAILVAAVTNRRASRTAPA